MQAIWKFPLAMADKTVLVMPRSAAGMCVQMQGGAPYLWVFVNDIDEPKIERTYTTYGTGHQHKTIGGRYIGTYQLSGGSLVFHVFEDHESR